MHGLNNAQLPLTVGILVFDQVEVLDVAGPFEVFTVARLNKGLRQVYLSPLLSCIRFCRLLNDTFFFLPFIIYIPYVFLVCL